MDFTELWKLVSGGGDVAIFAVLYYVHSIQSKVNTLEVKYNSLKSWVTRIDDKIERRNTHQ